MENTNTSLTQEQKQNLEEYEKSRKRNIKRGIFIALIVLGAALIVSGILFRTQYPMKLTNEGWKTFRYSHVLQREVQHFDAKNNYKGSEIKYYVCYTSGVLLYEKEVSYATYSSHASKENLVAGITDHTLIDEKLNLYTFSDKDCKAYCYEKETSILKALFDRGNSTGKFYLRAILYVCGAALVITFSVLLKKTFKKAG